MDSFIPFEYRQTEVCFASRPSAAPRGTNFSEVSLSPSGEAWRPHRNRLKENRARVRKSRILILTQSLLLVDTLIGLIYPQQFRQIENVRGRGESPIETFTERCLKVMQIEIAFIGMGNVARAFARLLHRQREQLQAAYGLSWNVTGIATYRHGSIACSSGVNLDDCLAVIERGSSLTAVPGCADVGDAGGLLEQCNAHIVFETTPLSLNNGEPATGYIRQALTKGMNVVTANKGPVAFAYAHLRQLAEQRGVQFRFEGTVMDGTPVFNLVEFCLPGTRVLGFAGVLNSTTNIVLSGMESGRSFDDCLNDAKRAGIAELNADYDIDGWDAAVKSVALARVLMGADITPAQVNRTGIREIGSEDLVRAASTGKVIRLIARGRSFNDGIELTVAPEAVPAASGLGSVRGTSNVLILNTDLMGEIAIVENDPTVEQTAYALLSDMLQIHRELSR